LRQCAWIELPGDQSRHQARVRRKYLVRADHREAATEKNDDRTAHAGELERWASHSCQWYGGRIIAIFHAFLAPH